MPASQYRGTLPHSRRSWLPRLAGIGVVVILAGAVAGYLVVTHRAPAHRSAPLPTKVVSYQTVGLVASTQLSETAGQLLQLLEPSGQLQFAPLSAAQQAQGSGQWSANQMAGNTYIFIYLPNQMCLTAIGTQAQPKLGLQHCDLEADQRWRRTGDAILSAQGHQFFQYANLGNGTCLTQTGELPDNVWGASLQTCLPLPDEPPSQLIAFWWGTV